jgi:hypothetical protein
MPGVLLSREAEGQHNYFLAPLDRKFFSHGVKSLSCAWGFASIKAMYLLHA